MSRALVIALLTLVVVGCGSKPSRFKLEGRMLHMDQGEFYVYSLDGSLGGLDTIKVRGGRFNYEIDCAEPTTLYMVFPNFSETPIFAEPGKKASLEADASHLKELTIDGTDDNKLMNRFRQSVVNASPPQTAKMAEQFIRDHAESPVSTSLLRTYFILGTGHNYSKALRLCDVILRKRPRDGLVVAWSRQLKQLSRADVSKPLPHFSAVTIDGRRVTQADFNHGVGVIYVWASWDYRARDMQRQLKDLKETGMSQLHVLSINVDPSRQICRQALGNDSASWPTVCDGQLLESPLMQSLGFFSVPDNMIVFDGNIEARNLRQEQLLDKLRAMR